MLTRSLRADLGVMISASHNPYEDNGIKFFSGDGFKLPDAFEAQIEHALEFTMGCHSAAQLGRARRIDDAAGRYVEFCKSTFPFELDLKGMKLVVDCAHGAAYQVGPHVFHELGADVVSMGVSPDGININDKVGATSPLALVEEVKRNKADYGIALDGDADRLVMVDASGTLYDGDQLLFAVVKQRTQREKVAGVAGTLMTNLGMEQAIGAMGLEFGRAKVGDRYVLEMLREKGWLYGGENSGHIICLDKHTTGDGIVSALQVLTSIRQSGRSLAELTSGLSLYPQVLLNVKVARGFDWRSHASIAKASEEVQRELDGHGRVLLRPSGTEPVLRVMVEGEPRALIEKGAQAIATAVQRAAGT
jgi:phosphoglucosamine mutase